MARELGPRLDGKDSLQRRKSGRVLSQGGCVGPRRLVLPFRLWVSFCPKVSEFRSSTSFSGPLVAGRASLASRGPLARTISCLAMPASDNSWPFPHPVPRCPRVR